MSDTPAPSAWAGFARLRAYAEARRRQTSAERCELCGLGIEPEHGHLVNLASRSLLCVCRPCSLLFAHDGAGGARFRAVPERYERLPSIALADEIWAGATESELPLEPWDDLVRLAPALASLEPDVEALLVRWAGTPAAGVADVDPVALIVPIDVCYELVGRIRSSWRGFQGGDEVWQEIDAVFARAIARAAGMTPA